MLGITEVQYSAGILFPSQPVTGITTANHTPPPPPTRRGREWREINLGTKVRTKTVMVSLFFANGTYAFRKGV